MDYYDTADKVPCQGLHDRKYEVLYDDGNAGTTTPRKLWLDSRQKGKLTYKTPDGEQIHTTCECCTEYAEWKKAHSTAAKALQHIADIPCYYKVCDEQVRVHSLIYQRTIRALHSAPKGACVGTASQSGPHPYTCEACEALQHGKDSQLLYKLLRASKLKYPRSKQSKPSQRGIRHKYCSKAQLESALQHRKDQGKTQSKKLTRLLQAN